MATKTKKWTKWIPLGRYSHGYVDFVVMVKKNLRTGMPKFKVKRIHRWKFMSIDSFFNVEINTQEVWDKLIQGDDDGGK